jgi:hypothetical protein
VSRYKPPFRRKFNLDDKVYWRSNSGSKDRLKCGVVVAIIPPLIPIREIVMKFRIEGKYSTWRVMAKSISFRDHESYLVAVSEIDGHNFISGTRVDGHYYENMSKPHLYWPIVKWMKPDTREPLPEHLRPESKKWM